MQLKDWIKGRSGHSACATFASAKAVVILMQTQQQVEGERLIERKSVNIQPWAYFASNSYQAYQSPSAGLLRG